MHFKIMDNQDKKESLPINTRAQFILLGLEKNCPKLYEFIMSINDEVKIKSHEKKKNKK